MPMTWSLTMRQQLAMAKLSAAGDNSASSFPVSLASSCRVAYTLAFPPNIDDTSTACSPIVNS